MAVTVDEVKAHLRIQHDEEDPFVRPAFDTRSEDAYDEIRRVLKDELLK